MNLLIISDAPTLKQNNQQFAYAPYVKEINIWMKYAKNTTIVSPTKYNKQLLLAPFEQNFKLISIPAISLVSLLEVLKTIYKIPFIIAVLSLKMKKADHIHLRNPGSIGLLACIVQVFFPKTKKTSKYAGNWDPKSKQPLSYKLQKWILSNTFLTKNCKVLVYGNWKNQSKNIKPFFTASYKESEIEEFKEKDIKSQLNFIFVGTFSEGKQPLKTVKTIQKLFLEGYKVQLNMYGNGPEFKKVREYILQNNLQECIILHGNQPKDVIKNAYQKSHFLLFISKSEGWPKVVAEAMFWGCLPISSDVSCVSYMLDFGNRGSIISPNSSVEQIFNIIISYVNDKKTYKEKVLEAQKWSQNFTLNKFEIEIKNLF